MARIRFHKLEKGPSVKGRGLEVTKAGSRFEFEKETKAWIIALVTSYLGRYNDCILSLGPNAVV